MILADKIMNERKRNGWSQEELAEKLGVSRQSVSKWEGAQSVPDLNRIIQMADIFGVTTDYLLKDEIEAKVEPEVIKEHVELEQEVINVSMEEASEYLQVQKEAAPWLAFGVSLCILSPIVLILLAGLSGTGIGGISENAAGAVGIVVLLVMVATAVVTFIKIGSKTEKFQYLEKMIIETAYGVDGMVKEKKNETAEKFNMLTTIAIVLCILSCLPLLIASFMTEQGLVLIIMVCILLALISVAVNIFVRVGTIKESYDKLLQTGDYTIEKKKVGPILGTINVIYWTITVAIYLAISLPTQNWQYTWVIWPVAGVLYAAVIAIAKAVLKVQD